MSESQNDSDKYNNKQRFEREHMAHTHLCGVLHFCGVYA